MKLFNQQWHLQYAAVHWVQNSRSTIHKLASRHQQCQELGLLRKKLTYRFANSISIVSASKSYISENGGLLPLSLLSITECRRCNSSSAAILRFVSSSNSAFRMSVASLPPLILLLLERELNLLPWDITDPLAERGVRNPEDPVPSRGV